MFILDPNAVAVISTGCSYETTPLLIDYLMAQPVYSIILLLVQNRRKT